MAVTRKTLRLAFTDFPGPFNPTRLQSLLARQYDVSIDHRNPDYVIHSEFGYDHLCYPEAVRIFFTGENVHPDFNLSDYAFGYDWLEFGDRHYRCPNYQLYDQFKELCQRRRSVFPTNDLRESPIVDVIERLLGTGFNIRIYDPHMHLASLTGANRGYILQKIPYIARFIADDLPAVLAHAELIMVVNDQPGLRAALSALAAPPLVYEFTRTAIARSASAVACERIAW